jgi:hypothetical protein
VSIGQAPPDVGIAAAHEPTATDADGRHRLRSRPVEPVYVRDRRSGRLPDRDDRVDPQQAS